MLMLAAVCFLLDATPPTPVTVATTRTTTPTWSLEDQRRLHGWLVLRLVEAGYAIVPSPAEAALTLEIVHTEHGIDVHTTGHTTHVSHVEHGTPALMQLETLHRAIETLDKTEPRSYRHDGDTPRVVLQVQAQASADSPDQREPIIAASLLEAGAALHPAGSPHDAVACVSSNEAGVSLHTNGPEGPCSTRQAHFPVTQGELDSSAVSRTTAIWVERVRASVHSAAGQAVPTLPPPPGAASRTMRSATPVAPIASPPPTTTPNPDGPHGRAPSPRDNRADRLAMPRSYLMTAGLQLGGASRGERLDGAFGLEVGGGSSRGLWLGTMVLLQPSRALDSSLTVIELALLGGIGMRWPLSTSWNLTSHLAGGARRHAWWFGERDSSSSWDGVIAVPVELSWASESGLELGLAVRPAVFGHAREHVTDRDTADEQRLWTSPPWSIAALLCVRNVWELR